MQNKLLTLHDLCSVDCSHPEQDFGDYSFFCLMHWEMYPTFYAIL